MNCGLCISYVSVHIYYVLESSNCCYKLQAFRRLYEEVGLGWIYAVTKYKPVSSHLQRAKHMFRMFISFWTVAIQFHTFYKYQIICFSNNIKFHFLVAFYSFYSSCSILCRWLP
jgi:hypothetical protein